MRSHGWLILTNRKTNSKWQRCGDGHEFRRLDYRELFAASFGDLDTDNKNQV